MRGPRALGSNGVHQVSGIWYFFGRNTVYRRTPSRTFPEDDFDRVMRVNLKGVFYAVPWRLGRWWRGGPSWLPRAPLDGHRLPRDRGFPAAVTRRYGPRRRWRAIPYSRQTTDHPLLPKVDEGLPRRPFQAAVRRSRSVTGRAHSPSKPADRSRPLRMIDPSATQHAENNVLRYLLMDLAIGTDRRHGSTQRAVGSRKVFAPELHPNLPQVTRTNHAHGPPIAAARAKPADSRPHYRRCTTCPCSAWPTC